MSQSPPTQQLEGGAYEIIRARLESHAATLRERLSQLNAARQGVFGAVEAALIATERIATQHNCIPRDMVAIGHNRFLFGYNVHLGLKSQMELSDVFALYEYNPENHTFHPCDLAILQSGEFEAEFTSLYKYYKNSVFAKFHVIGPHLYMAFQVGKEVTDLKTFKWLLDGEKLTYLGNRFDHELVLPPQQEFEWKRARRDMHRQGAHPHISIEDRVFVETIGGDLTLKIEDNTASGEGLYSEAVTDRDQTLDDAEIYYACVGSLILLKILPYQEKLFRYLVYNEKVQRVYRVPGIKDSCVRLPDDQGLIFANGYLLQTGSEKLFESDLTEMRFERRIPSPNGEDTMFVFHNRRSGDYVLLSYNIITQTVETPILCHGFTIFPNGQLIYFKTGTEPQKHHVLQVWKTPYSSADTAAADAQKTDSYLYRVGNPPIVRAMAECQEILTLLGKDDSYADLYLDLVRRTRDICDSYFWVGRDEAFKLNEPLLEINGAAQAAIAEFDKVVRLRRAAADETKRLAESTAKLTGEARRARPDDIMGFVHILSGLRSLRGELISLRDVRYVEPARIAEMEKQAEEAGAVISEQCVKFLQTPEALNPYRKQVALQEEAIPAVTKVIDAEKIEKALDQAGGELDMLIEIVSNLKIADATQTTQIIDSISVIYAQLNQVKVALKNKKKELARGEGAAQFNAQLKLLSQAVVNYLDLCTTPEKCDEYLTRTMIQLEELEGRFSEFEEYTAPLTEKRDELFNAFESRKLNLTEARNRRALSLLTSGQRILTGIRRRVAQMKSLNEINGYLAADLMVEKLQNVVKELQDLGDTVKADDLNTQLKTLHDEAVRQLKDRQELFVEGENIIQFGKHRFSVNTQELELTIVPRDGMMCFHLTGTGYFEPVTDERFLATREVWEQSLVSENAEVYRAEYLAWQFFASQKSTPDLAALQAFMAPRYDEGYTKGVHDQDAFLILKQLAATDHAIGLLRYSPKARALGLFCWLTWNDAVAKALLEARLLANGGLRKTFHPSRIPAAVARELTKLVSSSQGAEPALIEEAAEYLFHELSDPGPYVVSPEAAAVVQQFQAALTSKRAKKRFDDALKSLETHPTARCEAILDWVRAFLAETNGSEEYAEEAAGHLWRGGFAATDVVQGHVAQEIKGLTGTHPLVGEGGVYAFHYNRFMEKLRRFEATAVPRFREYTKLKTALIEARRAELRLGEFRAKVMSAFVRNRLLDQVYLPLIGANLAKQIGVVGNDTRTDRMGLLLLISPPGYGKTTLMEYVANRLGITFIKINGPAIGHRVTSLDPQEAPNASAREEILKLNLALEMGDNVVIYLDDIQHCNPELLQKFISLCDAQRKIEGVWRGQARTYDLRGKKVAVVMAGNPYTESGTKFQIPDMLANRADTYNLGDISGAHAGVFDSSYIENCLTSNPVLAKLSTRGQADVLAVMRLAETGSQEGVDFEGNYSAEDVEEFTNVMKKLFRVRDTLLRVNRQYIASAAQQDVYRTEPPFRLQGSYRNMNRIAERILPLMTDAEVETLIQDHYENEAQNLTTGAEANLLKFREMENILSETEAARWEEIKTVFRRNQFLGGAGENDPVSRVVGQLALFGKGLEDIRLALGQVTVSPEVLEWMSAMLSKRE